MGQLRLLFHPTKTASWKKILRTFCFMEIKGSWLSETPVGLCFIKSTETITTVRQHQFKVSFTRTLLLYLIQPEWIMFTVGNVDRYIDRYIGRRSGRQSIDTRSTLGRLSIETRSRVDRVSIECRSTLDRVSAECRSTIDRYVDRLSVDWRSI